MFMVLVPILLLNMLIAMMGNTYAHVIEQSEKEWMKQVLRYYVDIFNYKNILPLVGIVIIIIIIIRYHIF